MGVVSNPVRELTGPTSDLAAPRLTIANFSTNETFPTIVQNRSLREQ